MDILVLVVALVLSQIIAGVVMMTLFMNPRVLKWFMRKYMKTVNEVSDYLIEEDLVQLKDGRSYMDFLFFREIYNIYYERKI